MPQNYLGYLARLGHKGIHLGLGPTSRLLKKFDNPQRRYKSIIIGGTNGKGSVAAILSSILGKTGKKIGLYTSPHLIDFRERIRVNGTMISQERLSYLTGLIREKSADGITFFEFTTVLAFLHFYLEGVDIVVLEVGMGGRLDATNVVMPEVSVITNVSLEHKEYLGSNIESIAREKGGIIKRRGFCITGATQPAVINVLHNICLQKRARLFTYGKDIAIRTQKGGVICYRGINKTFNNLQLPLIGRHQVKNASLALAAVEVLVKKGLNVADSAVYEGMKDVKWEGRLEILCNNPQIVVDGAHNPAGISVLCRALTDYFTYKRLICVFATLSDKDSKGMLRRLSSIANHIILTRTRDSRGSEIDKLVTMARNLGIHHDAVPQAKKAVEKALFLAEDNDLICITGSIYLVGEIKKTFKFNLF
ncbi:MAG: bifunctional folylpolyglutamate synthase/dihydrofolate synthase [Deltaproteobacteria bacterium]|nr:bifunctional folylpolyglutamate synthase/dihydrofolate synthase [Deltaproteobacteria bacterium]